MFEEKHRLLTSRKIKYFELKMVKNSRYFQKIYILQVLNKGH